MNTYRRCKAKKKLKRNELVNFTTVEVFGKPVHVPTDADTNIWAYHKYRNMCYENGINLIYVDSAFGRDYSIYRFLGTSVYGQMLEGILMAVDLQEHHDKFMVVVNSLKQLDYCVKRGIQPSNIQMVGEEDCQYIRITPDGIVKA